MTQSDIAHLIQVSEATITNWENNLTEPEIRYYPSIIRLLGYNPFTLDENSFSSKIKYCRIKHGLSHKQLGKKLGVDATTIGNWEKGEHSPRKRLIKTLSRQINALLQGFPSES